LKSSSFFNTSSGRLNACVSGLLPGYYIVDVLVANEMHGVGVRHFNLDGSVI